MSSRKTLRPTPDGSGRHPGRVALVVGSSGGGAHLTAADAIEQRLPDDVARHRVDLLEEWAGPFGRLGVGVWNAAMRTGNARVLNVAIGLQRSGERVFHLPVLMRARRALRDLEITEIHDCQVMGTRAILEAVEQVEKETGRRIAYTKVLTEPAHDGVTQYFAPIRALPDRLRSRVHVWASPPMLKPNETSEQFWAEHCKLPRLQVRETCDYPVRTPFRDAARAVGAPVAVCEFLVSGKRVVVQPSADVVTIVTGSQGTRDFILQTVRRLLEIKTARERHVFVTGPDASVRALVDGLSRAADNGTRIHAVPRLDAVALAALYRRSNLTVTRSGGMTCFELLATSNAPALVCTTPGRKPGDHGMVDHEYGNYRYLAAFHRSGARMVRPDELAEALAGHLRPGEKTLARAT